MKKRGSRPRGLKPVLAPSLKAHWKPELVDAWDRFVAAPAARDHQLRRYQRAATDSPVYAWLAIDLCVRNKKKFPDWVIAYLGQCAKRMASCEAGRIRDVRKMLLWVLGFPKKKGPGPLLEPYSAALKWLGKLAFTANFAKRLDKGEDPVTARGSACNDTFAGVVDDRTLQRYLREVFRFRLTSLPSTREEWKPVINEHRLLLKTVLREMGVR